jgi:hypothetical protein
MARFLFQYRYIANSTAARSAESFVKADFRGRSWNKHTPWQKSRITDLSRRSHVDEGGSRITDHSRPF